MPLTSARSTTELFDLSGRVAIVTGAPGQLGRVMSEALAEQGAHVVVVSRTASECHDLAENLSAEYQDALAVPADVTDASAVAAMTAEVEAEFGGVDILVNNAYSGDVEQLEEMSVEQFRAGLDGALTSTFLCTRDTLPLLRESENPAIVNIASIYGIVAPDHRIYGDTGLNNPPQYGAAKAGVIQFTRWVATRYARERIRANTLTPGGIYNSELEEKQEYTDVFVPNYEDRTPLGRMGEPEDIKGAVAFLASDASQWMTGQNLIVDGGWTVW